MEEFVLSGQEVTHSYLCILYQSAVATRWSLSLSLCNAISVILMITLQSPININVGRCFMERPGVCDAYCEGVEARNSSWEANLNNRFFKSFIDLLTLEEKKHVHTHTDLDTHIEFADIMHPAVSRVWAVSSNNNH